MQKEMVVVDSLVNFISKISGLLDKSMVDAEELEEISNIYYNREGVKSLVKAIDWVEEDKINILITVEDIESRLLCLEVMQDDLLELLNLIKTILKVSN